MAKINPVAKALASGSCRPQVVKARKGKGSYSRRERYRPLGRY